jgi:hypothetical protein
MEANQVTPTESYYSTNVLKQERDLRRKSCNPVSETPDSGRRGRELPVER